VLQIDINIKKRFVSYKKKNKEREKKLNYNHCRLLGACIFGHGLGALAHSMLGQLTRQQQAHTRLYFTTRYGRSAVVVRQLGGLVGDALENVVDKRVHDAHAFARDARVGMHLL